MSGLSEQQLAEIRARLYQVRALSAADVDITALLAEVARLNAPLPGEEAIREQVRRVLAAADNYPYEELEPHDYQEQATVTVDMIRPLVAELGSTRARVAELEAERHSTNEALSEAAEALREKGAQPPLSPHERLILRFALEMANEAIYSNPADFSDEDTAAMDKLRALATGPTVAYRNPWRPGVLLCLEHGEGWAGMKPLSVEDLPNGGTCTAGDPADPDDVCGRDVLATEAGDVS